jgi:hypothetical protein
VKKRNVTAIEYLVVGVPAAGHAPRHRERYAELWKLAGDIMQCMEPSGAYVYSSIAVTKQFQSSPHVDMNDKTWQFAFSVGDFDGGGELCVEMSPSEVCAIDTHNRLAQIDGRYVHWVAPYEGERFSVVYYRVDGEATPRERAVYLGVEEMAVSVG